MKLKIWESALLLTLAIAVGASASALSRQRELAYKLIRLHVVANSDSEEDQRAKLYVRDAVLAYIEPRLRGAADRAEAESIISSAIPGIESAAETAACRAGQPGAKVTLSSESFPARDYGTFALPAGEYLSLRVVIGEGAGHNWWCVVFPPLCAAQLLPESAEAFGLSRSDADMMFSGYTVRFKLLDWINELKKLF